MGVRYALPPLVLLFSRILYCTAFHKITKIVRPLWLAQSVFAWGYVNMVVASKCFAFRALITQAQIWKRFHTFQFTHSLVGWNLENLWKHAVSIWFRLSWHFKRKNSYFWKASLFQKRTDYAASFVYKTLQLVRISLLITALKKEFSFFLTKVIL